MGRRFVTCCMLLGAGCASGAAPARPAAPRPAARVTLVSARAPVAGAPFTVVVYLSTTCPIANAYTPELARIVRDYAERRVAFLVVYPDPDTGAEDARAHAAARHLDCPIALDHDQHLARRLHATHTPEAIVLDEAGGVRYQGRIDDTWLGYQRRRHAPRQRDLRQALDALLDGRRVATARTAPIGCPLPELPE